MRLQEKVAGVVEWLASLRELQSQTGEELSALLPSCVEE
jgi:hypothetical protein